MKATITVKDVGTGTGKASTEEFIQALKFPKSDWTIETAKEWLLKNGFDSTLSAEETSTDFVFNMDEADSFGETREMDILADNGVKAIIGPKIKRKFAWKMRTLSTAKQDAVPDKRLVTGIVMEPDVIDTDNEFIKAETIEKSAHNFMEHFQKTNIHHMIETPQIVVVESFVTPMDMTIGGQVVKAGSWIMTVKVNDDDLWLQVKEGEEFTGFSFEGMASVGG